MLGTSAALATAAAAGVAQGAKRWAARPPAGFTRLSIPGRVVKVSKTGSLQSNGIYPKQAAAKLMLERAMTELTGKSSLLEAFRLFIHPRDKVAIKPNGIAGKKTMKMASNKELIVEIAKAVVAVGVPPENITIFEQYRDFLFATRCITDKDTLAPAPEFPAGVRTAVHLNRDAEMDAISINGISTKYVRPFTQATAVINVSQVKDHGICGYTGTMKNITHGANINPQRFHAHRASPQIAHMYAQEVIKSRVVLHITDAFQVIYDGGPIDKFAKRRVPFESIYASTDPVALDVVGWKVVDKLRAKNGLPSLERAGRKPTYIQVASQRGLGVFDEARIDLRELTA